MAQAGLFGARWVAVFRGCFAWPARHPGPLVAVAVLLADFPAYPAGGHSGRPERPTPPSCNRLVNHVPLQGEGIPGATGAVAFPERLTAPWVIPVCVDGLPIGLRDLVWRVQSSRSSST